MMSIDREATLAAALLDSTDEVVLGTLRRALDDDPPPLGLCERIKFRLSLAALEAEMAHIVSSTELAGVRSTAYARTTSVTFAGASLSVMITTEESGPRLSRINGWTSVPGVDVEVRERSRTVRVRSDTEGRFHVDGVEKGMVHFIFRRTDDPTQAPVITPAIEI